MSFGADWCFAVVRLADVPVMFPAESSMTRGSYTAGEPAVKYRGIFFE